MGEDVEADMELSLKSMQGSLALEVDKCVCDIELYGVWRYSMETLSKVNL